MKDGIIKTGAAVPQIRLGDTEYNTKEIIGLVNEAQEKKVKIMVFPQLCISGSCCGNLFYQTALIEKSKEALFEIINKTKKNDVFFAVGLPFCEDNKLYNCAAVVFRGKLLGIVAKKYKINKESNNQNEYFSDFLAENKKININGNEVIFGSDIIFTCDNIKYLQIAVNIGGDISSYRRIQEFCDAGANVILNLCADSEIIGLNEKKKTQITAQTSLNQCAYISANAGLGESTTDNVFSGYSLISQCGKTIAENNLFSSGLIEGDIDLQKIANERVNNFYSKTAGKEFDKINFSMEITETELTEKIDASPFIPKSEEELKKRCELIYNMQSHALAQRMKAVGTKNIVLAISGGLDSTLALLAVIKTYELLGYDAKDIITISMPGFGTSERTYKNTLNLCSALNVTLKIISITDSIKQHFSDIGHDIDKKDLVYENSQARERTQIAMDTAIQYNGFVVGTGDLSELALGFATYNGDHMSMYGINASVPKTLISHLIKYYSDKTENELLKKTLIDIIDTPVSPELLPAEQGKISQITENIIGPYELHDFFLYYFVRWNFTPKKIFRFAKNAFFGKYDDETIKKWLTMFYKRFFTQQYKRSCLPDGPGVGSVSFSPRTSWHMPSDISYSIWLSELNDINI